MKAQIPLAEVRAGNQAPSLEDPSDWISVAAFAARYRDFKSESAIRHEIFMAQPRRDRQGRITPGNGLMENGVLLKIGNRIFISPTRYFAFWRGKSQQADSQPDQQPDQQIDPQFELNLTTES